MPKSHASRRHTTAQHGCVKFPVASPDYPGSDEGGLFVKLVVLDPQSPFSDWDVCVGTEVIELKTGVLVGDDQLDYPKWEVAAGAEAEMDPMVAIELVESHDNATRAWSERHFPGDETQHSRSYRAVVQMGATGWTGYNESLGRYWACTVDDLNDAGRAVYDALKAMYPGCTLHLLTFLDT